MQNASPSRLATIADPAPPIVLSLRANTPEKAEEERRALAAVATFAKGKHPGPLPRTYWMGDGYLELYVFNRRVHLAAVFVLPDSRHKGHGSAYLRKLLAAADAHGSMVECTVQAFGDNHDKSRLNNRQLTAWYKRHGFELVQGRKNFLVRAPKNTSAAPVENTYA